MRLILNSSQPIIGLIAVVIAGSFSTTAAQEMPDFEGIWSGDRVAGPRVHPLAPAVVTPAGQTTMDSFELLDDPAIQCVPNGLSRQARNPYPMEITRYDDYLTFRYEEWTTTRTIYTDGRAHPENVELSRLGHSTGRYDGQTLIVETVGMTPHLIDNVSGLHSSEELRVTERYTLEPNDRFERIISFEMTLDDPVMLEEPYVLTKAWSWAPDLELLTFECLLRDRPAATRD
jgi:hypothetical protein